MKFFRKKPKTLENILDQTLYKLPNTNEKISYADAVKGTLIMGATGSGKSSGPGKYIATAKLKHNFGMCILCSKKNEASNWLKLIEKVAPERMKDVKLFNKKSDLKFNFLEYEMTSQGEGAGDVLNVLELLMSLNDLINVYLSGSSSSGEDQVFWQRSLRRYSNRSIRTLNYANEPLHIENLLKLGLDCLLVDEAKEFLALERLVLDEKSDPVKRENAKEQLNYLYANNFLIRTLASSNTHSEDDFYESSILNNYWLKGFPKMGERITSTVIESFMGLLEPFLNKGILKSHFSSELSPELLPENCYLKNSIMIIDFPIK